MLNYSNRAKSSHRAFCAYSTTIVMGSGMVRIALRRNETTLEKVARLFKTKANTDDFFYKVYIQAMTRSPAVKRVLTVQDLSELTDIEMAIIWSLAKSVRTFYEMILFMALEDDKKGLDRLCMLTGSRHVKYTQEKFEPAYWDVFIIAMTDVLEGTKPRPTNDEVYVWQDFIRGVVDKMRTGYEIAYEDKTTTDYKLLNGD